MKTGIYIGAGLLAVAAACASDLPDALSAFRVRHVGSHAYETILLSKRDQIPKPKTALAANPVKRMYIREGDKMDGSMVIEVNKTNRTAKLQKDGKTIPVQFGPSGVQTSLWAELISTTNDAVCMVKVGDRLADEWTIASIATNRVVTASNTTGRIDLIPWENKESQPSPGN
jgi:hypothetical protein